MKSVILASTIFIIIVVLMCTSYIFMNTVTEDMSAILEQNEKFVAKNDWKQAKNEMDKLHNLWEEKHTLLSVIATHAMIDEIDYAISRLSTSVSLQEPNDFSKENKVLKMRIDDLKGHQKINISNLF